MTCRGFIEEGLKDVTNVNEEVGHVCVAGVAYACVNGTDDGAEAVACLGTDEKALVVELSEVVGLVGTGDT